MAEKEFNTLPGVHESDLDDGDNEGLFHFPEFEQTLQSLVESIHQNHLMTLLVGEPGCGKTSMLKRFLVDEMVHEPNLPICHVQARPEMTEQDLLRQIGHHFGITEGGAELPFEVLRQHLRAPKDYDHFPLLVLDDAHLVTPEQMQTLLKLEGRQMLDGEKTMTLVLFGEPSILDIIRHPGLGLPENADIHLLNMPYLTMVELEDYLSRRWGIAPGSYSKDQLDRLHRSTFGIPGRVNEEIHAFTSTSPMPEINPEAAVPQPRRQAESTFVPGKSNRRLVLLFGFLILALVPAIWFFLPSGAPARKGQPAAIPSASPAKADPPKVNPQSSPTEQPAEGPEAGQIQTQNPQAAPGTEVQDAAGAPVASAHADGTAAVADSKTEPVIENQPQEVDHGSQPVKSPAPSTPKPAAPGAEAKVSAAEKPPLTSTAGLNPKSLILAEGAAAVEEIKREGWILGQNPAYFSIQLLGTRWEKRLHRFVDQYGLYPSVAYYRTQLHGEDWYPLLYGLFETSDEARAAIANLPEEIRAAKPWVRNISSIQDIVRDEVRRRRSQ